MSRKRKAKKSRRRGPPRVTGPGTLIGMRVHKPFLALLDDWRKQQEDQPSRPDAMRLLAEARLRQLSPERKARTRPGPEATEMAAQVIDALTDPSVPAENRAKRKRRLLKGPEEFRDIRDDQPKSQKRS
jgi:hypothetical protein